MSGTERHEELAQALHRAIGVVLGRLHRDAEHGGDFAVTQPVEPSESDDRALLLGKRIERPANSRADLVDLERRPGFSFPLGHGRRSIFACRARGKPVPCAPALHYIERSIPNTSVEVLLERAT